MSPSRKSKETKTDYNWLAGAAVAFLLAMVSLLLYPGYAVGIDDLRYFPPAIQANIEPYLYARDFLMSASQAEATLFDEVIAAGAGYDADNLPATLFWVMFVARMAFFLGVSLLAFAFTRNVVLALLMPLVFVVAHHAPVSNAYPPMKWFFSFELEPHPRALGMSLGVLALGLYFVKRHLACWLLLTLAAVLHPLSVLPLLAALGAHSLAQEVIWHQRFAYLGYYLLPVIGLVLMSVIVTSGQALANDLWLRMDRVWVEFSQIQTPWVFISEYFTPPFLLGIVLPLFLMYLIAIAGDRIRADALGTLTIISAVFVALIFFSVLAFDQLQFIFFGQLQLHRALHYLTILLPVAALSALALEITDAKGKMLPKVALVAAFVVICTSGEYIWLPLGLATLFAAILVLREKLFRSDRILGAAYLLLIIVAVLGTAIRHPDAVSQLHLLRDFVLAFGSDIVTAFGLFTLWAVKPTVALLIIIVMVLFAAARLRTPLQTLALLLACEALALAVLALHFGDYTRIVAPYRPSTPTAAWVQQNVGKDDLIFVSTAAEDQGVELRNHQGKSIFFTDFGRSQGTFNRTYALEWQHRHRLRAAPRKHAADLARYNIDYYIVGNAEEPFEGLEPVFTGARFRVLVPQR
mgnify:CR=1 FL=1